MAQSRSPMPARPSIEVVGNASLGQGAQPSNQGYGHGIEDEVQRAEDESETVESLMNKLAIERRVQYGAEKMLDVIEKRGALTGGSSAGEEQEQVKDRISAQLEAANDHIKHLESRLERLKGSSSASTPSRNRRRPQPRLNGYASSSSLGLGQSFSSTSNVGLSASRPRFYRQQSNLTPENERDYYLASPSRSRPRSRSAGEDSFGSLLRSGNEWTSQVEREDVDAEGIAQVQEILRRLRNGSRGKGKAREERGDGLWELMNRLTGMIKKAPALVGVLDMGEVISCVIPYLADESTPSRRAAGYRLLRHVLDRASWQKMLQAGIEWLIIRTFTRDSKAITEREQALRLLRAVIVFPAPIKPARSSSRRANHSRADSSQSVRRHSRQVSASDIERGDAFDRVMAQRAALTDGLVRAIVSVAENPDDPMRVICMETLVEIGVVDLECLVRSDAFRTILLVFKDGPSELTPAITGLLLHLVNQPQSRRYLLRGCDLESVLVGLTEEHGKVPPRQHARYVERLHTSAKNVSMLLSSWPGLLYLYMDDCRAVKSLMSSLYAPVDEVKECVLDLIFSTLRIRSPAWRGAFLEGKRLTVYSRMQQATAQEFAEEAGEDDLPQNLNLVDHFISLVLAIFIEAGMLEALVSLIEGASATLGRKATLLLGEVLQMANRILPLQYAAKLQASTVVAQLDAKLTTAQALPRLFSGATEFADPNERQFALSALSSIDSLNRNQIKVIKQATRDKSVSTQDSLDRGQQQAQQTKLRLGLQVDDKQFQQMIVDSNVLLNRDHTKWNYDMIVELVEGPLLNPKRLDEAIKATKFIRRLFSFYHPYNNRFSSVKRTRPNHKWVKLGCSMICTMLVNAEGIRFLSEDKLLKQMLECFHEMDQYVGMPNAQPVFARDRIENSLTYGYFEFLGTLSKHKEGVKLLEKFKFFTCFYHLSEQRSRDDIMRIIIECFDYTIEAHPRIVLSKALTSAYMETRLFATHHLGRLLSENSALTDWALQLLITQLYDTAMEVCDVAVMYLEEACTDPYYLEKVVNLRPTLEHLGDIGHPLFMRFVSTSAGFQYLHQAQYIERELESWLLERNLLYVIEVETFVSKTLRPFTSDTVEDFWTYDGTAPTHFFGELTRTPEGSALLKDKGLVADFAEIVRLHGMETVDQGIMMNVKSVLWALGNIGSTEGGLPFLEEEEIIEIIVEIAEQSPVLTMRGTCFFVIGLLSTTRMGAEILEEYGWIATRTHLGVPTGLCLPNDIGRFAQIERWERPDISSNLPALASLTGTEAEIITAIANLSNYVLAAGAMNNLKRIRNRSPAYFSSMTLFHRALRIISANHYQAPVRRFILDLFAIPLSPETLAQLRKIDADLIHRPAKESEKDKRRRSASSPGPEPPGRSIRARGLTISEMGARTRDSGVEDEDPLATSRPRERVRGGFEL